MAGKSSSNHREGGRGSFTDLDRLLEQLTDSPVIELGKPLPDNRHLPKWARDCPACHNRALLDRLTHLPTCEGGEADKDFSNQ